jgi:acylglycerol lipase
LSLLATLLASCAAPSYQAGLRPKSMPVSGITHRESNFIGDGGIRLFEQSWRAEKDPVGILVIVHGLKDHSGRYSEVSQELARDGYAVQSYDLRGHGDSAGDRVWIESFDDYVKDLRIFLARVRNQYPGKPLFLFGHSMGGAIATLFVLRDHPDIQGLVLSAPALKRGENVSGFLAATAKLLGTVAPRLAVLNLDDNDFSRDRSVIKAMAEDPLVYHSAGPARTGKELLKAMEEIQEKAPQLNVPFLVMHGTDDKVTNPNGSTELHSRARSENKTLKIYSGFYHDLLHEPGRDEVLKDLKSWLASRIRRDKK